MAFSFFIAQFYQTKDQMTTNNYSSDSRLITKENSRLSLQATKERTEVELIIKQVEDMVEKLREEKKNLYKVYSRNS